MILVFNIMAVFFISTNAMASCNPSFMVCADENGFSHWVGQMNQSYTPIINRVNKVPEKRERSVFINQEIEKCLPYEYHDIMKKVIKVESGGNPYAINVNGATKLSRQPSNYEEAVVTARHLINQGYSIDMGMAQINSQHFSKNGFLSKLGVSVEDIFDTCTNLRAGAKVFGDAYLSNNKNTIHALSVYNTGNPTRGIKNGYVSKVLAQ